VDECKTAVKRLHEAGIEVILDVVYNHTGEGNLLGPTRSFRASTICPTTTRRPAARYRTLPAAATRSYDHPRVLQLVTDSLRYGRSRCHVDGFRFDLAPALARENGRVQQGAAFFDAIRQDPAMSERS